MSWSDTHVRWQVVKQVETALVADSDAALRWRPEYAGVFADREALVAFLRYRWTLRLDAQLDPSRTEMVLDERHPALASARAGLALLDREAGHACAA